MASKAAHPLIEGVSGETPEGTVWAEVKATIKTDEYESVGVTLGQSLRVEGSSRNRRRARRQLLSEVEAEVTAKAIDVRRHWRARTT